MTQKLVLLSLADRAGENNECWPSLDRLMKDTCCGNRRTIIKAIKDLENLGLIAAQKAHGKANVYHLVDVKNRHQTSGKSATTTNGKSATSGNIATSGKSATPPVAILPPQLVANLPPEPISEPISEPYTPPTPPRGGCVAANAGDLLDEAAVIQLPIPAGQDPPEKPKRQKDSIPDCPYEALIALYHEEMPDNPTVKIGLLSDARKRLIRERWRQAATLRVAPFPNGYTTVEEGLACWRKFFKGCARSEFLTGKVPPTPPRTFPFFADIDFLFNAKRFINILEGKYHREAA